MKHKMKVKTSPDRVIRGSIGSAPAFSRYLVGLQYPRNNFRTNHFPAKSEEEHTEVEQKIQILLFWIKENSYYNSKESMNYIKNITETENITKD
jgi:hypothetical protein